MSMIEPCCCHKQLPKLLRDNRDRVCVFQTSGDVTMQKFNFAVAFMAGHEQERVLVLPKVDVMLLREVRHDVSKGWAKGYTLLVGKDCGMSDDAIAAELGDTDGKVRVVRDAMVRTGLFAMTGTEGTVVIVGDITSVADAGLKYYSAFFGTDEGTIKELLGAVRSRIRLKMKLL
jgi:hypothetical protein